MNLAYVPQLYDAVFLVEHLEPHLRPHPAVTHRRKLRVPRRTTVTACITVDQHLVGVTLVDNRGRVITHPVSVNAIWQEPTPQIGLVAYASESLSGSATLAGYEVRGPLCGHATEPIPNWWGTPHSVEVVTPTVCYRLDDVMFEPSPPGQLRGVAATLTAQLV